MTPEPQGAAQEPRSAEAEGRERLKQVLVTALRNGARPAYLAMRYGVELERLERMLAWIKAHPVEKVHLQR